MMTIKSIFFSFYSYRKPEITKICTKKRLLSTFVPDHDSNSHIGNNDNRLNSSFSLKDDATMSLTEREDPLMDKFNRKHTYLRISLTEKCNLRCTYCMPENGVELSPKEKLLSTNEILRLSRLFVNAGVTKIRLTGGEPTIRKDLAEIVEGLNELKSPSGLQTIGITTNGIALKRKLDGLVNAGLDQLNISLDTLQNHKFQLITRRNGLNQVLEAIHRSVDAISMTSSNDDDHFRNQLTTTKRALQSVKLNVVVMKATNEDEIVDFVKMTKDLPIYIRFIEYMPFAGNKWNKNQFFGYKDMLRTIYGTYSDVKKLMDDPNDTSKRFQVAGFKGSFGFITSMSDHFCGTCNRVRITADGNLKVCLFGNSEVSLRDKIREGASDSELLGIINLAVKRKKKQHADPPIEISLASSNFVSSFSEQLIKHSPISRQKAMLMSSPKIKMPITSKFKNITYLQAPNQHNDLSQLRLYTTNSINDHNDKLPQLSHVDSRTGKAKMVDISDKNITVREASAIATVHMSKEAFTQLQNNQNIKGDVLTVSQIAGMQAAKQTPMLIPLCHTIPLNKVNVSFTLNDENSSVSIQSFVKTEGKTGAEVEAMVAVSIAACTVFDMCKAVDQSIRISDIQVLEKKGGKRGHYKLIKR